MAQQNFNDLVNAFKGSKQIQEYAVKLTQLRNLDFGSLSDDEIRKKIFDYTGGFVTQSVAPVKKEAFNEQMLYRVRKIKQSAEDINLIRTFSYPNPNNCKYNGRANLKGRTVFYASDSPVAAILESKPEPGDLCFIGSWKPIATRDLHISVYMPSALNSKNSWRQATTDMYDKFEEVSKKIAGPLHEHMLLLNHFIADQFVYEKYPYPITSCLTNNNLYGASGIDFVVYPSVLTNANYCNFAIHPNIADRFLRLDNLIQLFVTEITEQTFRYDIGIIGHLDSTNIIWKPATEKEAQDVHSLLLKGGIKIT